MSATLKCSDGTEIKISKETEKELRKAFEKKGFRVWAFSVKEREDEAGSYVFALSKPYVSREDFSQDFLCRRGFVKKDIELIIKKLQRLIDA